MKLSVAPGTAKNGTAVLSVGAGDTSSRCSFLTVPTTAACSKTRLTALCMLVVFVTGFAMLRPQILHGISWRGSCAERLSANYADAPDRLHFRGTSRRLPACIIVGVRKCGTRAMLEFMKVHPKVQAASGEVHFFDNDDRYNLGLDWYRKRMPFSFPGQVTLEKSPAYFITDGVPERIYNMDNQTKIIVLVRDPTTRAISDYTQIMANKIGRGKSPKPFETLAINEFGEVNTSYKAIRIGLYYRHMERWFNVFPREQIRVVDGNNFIKNPVEELKLLEQFLGLDPYITAKNFYFNETKGFNCVKLDSSEKCLSDAKGRKHPDINPKVRKKLQDFYRPFNLKFYDQVGHDFGWP